MMNQKYIQFFVLTGGILISSALCQAENRSLSNGKRYIDYVRQCVDLLMEYGTDRYGEVETPILVSILDVETWKCLVNPEKLDQRWRVKGRITRRNPGGANLFTDQPLLRTMYPLSAAIGDDKYAQFARTYADYYMKNLVDKDDFFCRGWHRYYDVYEDFQSGDHARDPENPSWHEINAITCVNWETLWNVNSPAVQREIEAIWKWHVIDKQTGETDRHNNNGYRGCDFSMNAGAFINAFVFLY